MIIRDTFEATYPHYPFAPLVRAGIAIAAWLSGHDLSRGTDTRIDGLLGGAVGSAA